MDQNRAAGAAELVTMDVTIIRNLHSLAADAAGECRDALRALHELVRDADATLTSEPRLRPRLRLVELKVRNVLEYLTGNRE